MLASLTLAVIPQNITNQYENPGVTNAATEVIDGLTYEVVYLSGDFDSNKAKFAPEGSTGNYRYVLTADFNMTPDATHLNRSINLYGNAVILDLNGYALTTVGFTIIGGKNASAYFVPYCRTFELADSSAAQSGRVANAALGHYLMVAVDALEKVIVSGGSGIFSMNSDLRAHQFTDIEISITGGQYDLYFRYDDLSETKVKPSLAPWVVATYGTGGRITSAKSCAYFAISTTPSASGIYNYAYGYRWELTAPQLSKLAIPTDRTYYLWGRDQGGTYQYLDLQSGDETAYKWALGNLTTWYKLTNAVSYITIESNFVSGEYRNTVAFDCRNNCWEIMYLPVAVPRQADCVLSGYVKAPDFTPYAGTGCQGLFLGVLTELPVHGHSDTLQPDAILARTEITPNTTGDLSLTFNSGEHDVVYLVINGGYLHDGQKLSFVFNHWQLTMDYCGWQNAAEAGNAAEDGGA